MKTDVKNRNFLPEFLFNASRSSGAGGQNVNKVNTKVELRFHIFKSRILCDDEKILISEKLCSKINSQGFLIIVCQTERSQLLNKERTIKQFYTLLQKALTPVKKREETKPNASSKRKRLEQKRFQAEKKAMRRSGHGLDFF